MKKRNDIFEKRIAFYIGSLARGGAERVICNLAEFFYSQGYIVYVVTKEEDSNEYELSSSIIRIIADITVDEKKSNRIGNLKARIDKLTRIWKDIRPDVIVSFIRKNNLMAIASAKPLNIPVIVSVRSAPARELKGRGFKELTCAMFVMASGVVLQTREAKDFFPPYIQSKSIILPNSINPAFLKAKEDLDDQGDLIREKQIITVGRLDDNKNQCLLIDAFSVIANIYPEWSLHIYGDGEARERLQKQIEDSKLTNRIFLHGLVDDVPRIMKEASIFVLPSRIEGMPNALIEAMVMGMAVISTDCPCGGPRDILNGKNGVLVPVDNVYVMADVIGKLISDDELRTNMGKEAAGIVKVLHPDIVNNQWKQYIERIIYR